MCGGSLAFPMTTTATVPFGVASSTARLSDVLVQAPHAAFGRAHEDPVHGFRRPVDLERARAEHAELRALLQGLGVAVHQLDAADHLSPDLVYVYDPVLMVDRGAILLRSGKATRRGEEEAMAGWLAERGVPILGRIEGPGTVDGGDVCWLRPGLVAIGRTLRTNQAGIDQLVEMLTEVVAVFDLPYDRGPEECLHLMSVISPVADDLAVVELGRLPAGLWSLLQELEVELVEVPAEEVDSLGCNVLAVAPRVAVMLDANPATRARLEAAGAEVHVFSGGEVCWNGSGGPTCLTRPLRRA